MLDIKPIKERLNILLSDITEWIIADLQQLTEELERTRFLLKLKDERVEELKRKLDEQKDNSGESIYVGDFNGYKYYLSPKNTAHLKTWQEAKNYCSSLTIDGHNDWYLPNKEELNFLYQNKDNLPSDKGFIPTTYWSSTEDSSADAWEQYFANGVQSPTTKRFLLYARAIRKEEI